MTNKELTRLIQKGYCVPQNGRAPCNWSDNM